MGERADSQRDLSIPGSIECPFRGSREYSPRDAHERKESGFGDGDGDGIRRFSNGSRDSHVSRIRPLSLCLSLCPSPIPSISWSFDAPNLRSRAWKINCGARSSKTTESCGRIQREKETMWRCRYQWDKRDGSRSCKRAKVTRAVTNVQRTPGPPDAPHAPVGRIRGRLYLTRCGGAIFPQ